MITKAHFIIVSIITSILFACTQITGFGQGDPLEFSEVESGFYSGYPSKGYVEKIISSGAEFSQEWNKIHSNRMSEPDLPKIDFNSQRVVILMLDTKISGGYGIDEVEVRKNSESILITYTEVQPGRGCMTTQALTRPYKLISIPETKGPFKVKKTSTVKRDCR